jgi:arginase
LEIDLVTSPPRQVDVIGVPLDLGQTVRGTDVGPAAVRYAGLKNRLLGLGLDVNDLGNVPAPLGMSTPRDQITGAIASVCEALRDMVAASVQRGAVPLSLGGDHSLAIGSVTGSLKGGPVGLLWVDAHGDFNTPETSPSGNVHGMPLAVLLGRGDRRLLEVCQGQYVDPSHVALVGIRQLDPGERQALLAAGVTVFTMRDIDEQGMGAVATQAVQKVAGPGRIHVSFDIDALDPVDAPGIATPVRGGLTYREAHLLMEIVADADMLASMDVVEINPMLDVRNQTAHTAVDLIVSALGQSIL